MTQADDANNTPSASSKEVDGPGQANASHGASTPSSELSNRSEEVADDLEVDGSGEPIQPIVGVGASAGGVDALRTMFGELPGSTGMSFVVILHLSPDVDSNLPAVIQQVTSLSVTAAQTGTEVDPDHVYVIPPGHTLSIEDRTLHVEKITGKHDATTIDRFLKSLATDIQHDAIGIILSGTGTDGTIGLKAIREAGGVTMVQTPEDAEYDGMPKSALATGIVDIVGTSSDLAKALVAYHDHADNVRLPDPAGLSSDGRRADLENVFSILQSATNQDFSNYKHTMVLRRIERRMRLLGVDTLHEYLEVLEHAPDEVTSLRRDLLISVTSFFRDPEAFDALKETVIPRLFEQKEDGEPVRVWVTGCATGEEAYSLAMLLREEADRRTSVPDIQVFATDVDSDALSVGRAGVYPASITSSVSTDRLKRFFDADGSSFCVRTTLREMVLFAEHDILEDPPFSNVDMVSCRNLLIYLNQATQQHLLKLFHYALRPGGYLFLGRSEASGRTSGLFNAFDKSNNIFQSRQRADGRAKRIPVFPWRWSRSQSLLTGGLREKFQSHQREAQSRTTDTIARLHERLVMGDAASILVDDNYEIAHLSGGVHRFLKFPGGAPSYKILSCVPEGIRLELRSALYQAFKAGRSTNEIEMQRGANGALEKIEITVEPVTKPAQLGTGNLLPLVWIRFQAHPVEDPPDDEEPQSRERRLLQRLARTREQLQTTNEEYESTTEEMEAANEELLSMNEELQSKNEELQTSKEELQSVNEELKTTNQALKRRVDEVREAKTALESLMAATEIATVFLDRDLCIQRFTPAATDLFSIRPTDIGRPLSDFAQHFEYDELLDDVQKVLDHARSIKREIHQSNDRWFLARCSPYKTPTEQVEGVVLTFVDITEQRRLERDIVNATEREQHRIGQDLHDLLASRLTGASMMLQTLRSRVAESDETVSSEDIAQIIEVIHEAAEETRTLSHGLMPVALQESTLALALDVLARDMNTLNASTVRFTGDLSEEEPESNTAAMHLYRIAYEGVNNALKHAEADNIGIGLVREGRRLILTLTDDGIGIASETLDQNTPGEGIGLKSMKRRANLIGASFAITSGAGKGTTLRCGLPLDSR